MKQPRLTIELVPKTCWFSNVRSQVSKKDWDILKTESARVANYECEICNGRGSKWPVECHEVWSYCDATKTQRLERLISLCPSCHQVKHIGLATINGQAEIAKRHLAKINNWDERTTEYYILKTRNEWVKRSRYIWNLDLSWLDSKGIYYTTRKN